MVGAIFWKALSRENHDPCLQEDLVQLNMNPNSYKCLNWAINDPLQGGQGGRRETINVRFYDKP